MSITEPKNNLMEVLTMYKWNGIVFEDVEKDEDGHRWSGICQECKDKHNINDKHLDEGGSGCCMVDGCPNDADYYIDFPDNEVVKCV